MLGDKVTFLGEPEFDFVAVDVLFCGLKFSSLCAKDEVIVVVTIHDNLLLSFVVTVL